MSTNPIRTYTAGEVHAIVELLRDNPDIPPEQLKGMLFLVDILKHFELMTDADIEGEVRAFCRSNPIFPRRSSE